MRDSQSLLVKENGDGGDCSFDSGLYYSSCIYLHGSGGGMYFAANRTLQLLRTKDNLYYRHPRRDTWWSWTTSMSRDQSVSLQCLMVTSGNNPALRAMLQARDTVKTRLLHTNNEEEDHKKKFPDIVSPFELALWCRSFKMWYAYPLICLLDLDLLVELLLIRPRKLWDTDAALINKLIATESKYPTPVSKLVKHLYRFFNVERQIDLYYDGTEPGHRLPELAELAKLAYRKLIRTF